MGVAPMCTVTFWNMIGQMLAAVFTLGAAIGSWKAASQAKKSVLEQKKLRLVELQPVMSIDKIKKSQTLNCINVYFKNTGKGMGRVLKILPVNNCLEIEKAHIGTPISIGPSDRTNITIWHIDIATIQKLINLKFIIFYWDIQENCYATKASIVLDYGNDKFNWYVDYEKIEMRKEPQPGRVIQYERI